MANCLFSKFVFAIGMMIFNIVGIGCQRTVLPYLKEINFNRRVILASASPRRSELLKLMGLTSFEVIKSSFEENISHSLYSDNRDYCSATARQKGLDVIKELEKDSEYIISDELKSIILFSADTIVDYGGKIFEKPKDYDDAYSMLSQLNGKEHSVHTAVTIFGNRSFKNGALRTSSFTNLSSFVETSKVKFINMSENDIKFYLSTNEPFDKSGSYGIQGLGGQFVEKVDGCYFNVMGLPISRLSRELAKLFQNSDI